MSLSQTELEAHCKNILRRARIRNRVVILCEGDIGYLRRIPSPSAYKAMKKMPDANFYNACVPRIWKNNRPEFFNCGDRLDVLNTYFLLQQLHEKDPNKSYLEPKLLFAFVDLDLQITKIPDYDCSNTEDIFDQLYENFELKEDVIRKHYIFTTGLIYKEAYFLLPELQDFFESQLGNLKKPIYQDKALSLKYLYNDIIDNLKTDQNLQKNITIAAERFETYGSLNCTNVTTLQKSFRKYPNWESVAYPLLLVSQVKNYWQSMIPEADSSTSVQEWREQLTLKIGDFYSKSNNPKHHISAILREIYNYVYG